MSIHWQFEAGLSASGQSIPGEGASPTGTGRRLLSMPFHSVEGLAKVVELTLVVLMSVATGLTHQWLAFGTFDDFTTYFGVGVLAAVNSCAISAALGNYRPRNIINIRRELRDVTLTWVSVALLLLGAAFSLKITSSFSRVATIAFFATGWSALVAWRVFLGLYLGRALTTGAFAERKMLLIAEEGRLGRSRALFELKRCGYRPTKTIEIKRDDLQTGAMPPSLKVALDEIIADCRLNQIEDIFLLIDWKHSRCIEEILGALRVIPISIHLVPDEAVSRFLSKPVVNVGNAWTAELKRAPLSRSEQAFKRGVDIVLASIGVVMLSPLMLITALLIKLDSDGPVLFRQARNGFNGHTFRILKFRTMDVQEDGPVVRQATRSDPRVTRVGRLLRRTSIDELPQLFNVLRGDMSLVGPRPHAAAHNTEYENLVANYAFRHHVKPGITGWAQINGYRGETQTIDLMAKRIDLDVWYINNWSVWLEFRILVATLIVAFRQPAAY